MKTKATIQFGQAIRWFAGISIIPAIILPFYNQFLHGGRDAASILPRAGAYAEAHMLGAACSLLVLLGLVAIYHKHAERAGKLGLVSFLLAFFAQGLFACLLWGDGFFNPIFAQHDPVLQTHIHSPEFFEFGVQTWGLAVYLISAVPVLYIIAFSLFGAMIIRAGIMPRMIGVLFIVGSVLLGLAIMIPQWLESIGYAALGGSIAWGSWLVWRNKAPAD